jgi:hypothetical protein
VKRRAVVQASVAGGLVAATAGLAAIAHERLAPGPADGEGWRPIAWPFPRDAFPPGRAWRRGTTEVYVRPKLGFCGNCDTGVVADEEVDRVTDLDLLDPRFAPAKEGTPIRIGPFPGRARLYRYTLASGGTRHAEGIAVAQKCDLVVAVIAGNLADEPQRAAAYRFLGSSGVQGWLSQQLEGR